MVAGNGSLETAGVYVRKYFGGGKGAATGTQQAWKGLGKGGGR